MEQTNFIKLNKRDFLVFKSPITKLLHRNKGQLMLAFLLLIGTINFGQNVSDAAPDGLELTGVQDTWTPKWLSPENKTPLFQENVAKTEIHFQKNLSDDTNGLGSFTYETINPYTIKVDYKFERKTVVDPYKVNFSYFILKNADESYSMDMTAALAPMEMRMGDDVKIEYTGNKIHYPKELKIGQILPDAQGIIEQIIPEIETIKNEIKVSNRKVLREEIVDIEGDMHTAMVIFFEVASTKTIGDLLIMESKETVEEWLVPGLGIVNQVRTKKVHHCTRDCEKGGLDNHPSEEEYLVVKSIRINQ